jgi:hypothetical protein
MASGEAMMVLVVMASLLQGVASTAQATTEELLTELDKPSEYLTTAIRFRTYFVKNSGFKYTEALIVVRRTS